MIEVDTPNYRKIISKASEIIIFRHYTGLPTTQIKELRKLFGKF